MKKSISEESTVSQKRKPASRTVTETIDQYGNKTVIEYLEWDFGVTIPGNYFTTSYMKRLK